MAKTSLKDLEARIQVLETLLSGVERTSSPDRVPGWYFPGRVGIGTKWNNIQPLGKGAALSVSTAVDPDVVVVQHDGNEAGLVSPDERTCVKVLCTDPHQSGKGLNRGIAIVSANAPHNVAIDAYAQFSVDTQNLEIIKETEWKN